MIVKKVSCSEYLTSWMFDDGTDRAFIWNPKDGHVELLPEQLDGRKAVDVAMGFNQPVILDDEGYVWLGAGVDQMKRVDVDAAGSPFNGNKAVYGYYNTFLTIKNDGSIWYWGADDYNLFGGKPISPTSIGGPLFGNYYISLALGNVLLALTPDGSVWQWVIGNKTPSKVNLPGAASVIAASHNGFYFAIVNGRPFVWGYNWGHWGGNAAYDLNNPQDLTALWGLQQSIIDITCNDNAIHFIDALGDLWGLGDNAMGEVGDGQELVNHAEKYTTPYCWNWDTNHGWIYPKPVHIAPGNKFKKLFTGNSLVFYHYALDVNDNLYFWGRSKSFVGGDGIGWNQEDKYPNANDICSPLLRDPLSVKPADTIYYDFIPFTLTAGPDQQIQTDSASLQAKGTASKFVFSGRPDITTPVWFKWKQAKGAPCTIISPDLPSTQVTGLKNGSYVFIVQMTDAKGATISATVNITVAIIAPPPPATITHIDLVEYLSDGSTKTINII